MLNVAIGTLEAGLAVIVLRHLARFGRSFPWLAALMSFFFLRAADRLYVGLLGAEPLAFSLLVDGLAVVMLVLLIFGVEKTVRGLRAAENEAVFREQEYVRALVDYRRLMRHRIANPLAVIRGGVQALKEMPALGRDRQVGLLDAVDEATRRLEHVALEPDRLSKEESRLAPRPRGSWAADREEDCLRRLRRC